MSISISEDIKERERINATLSYFLSLSAWTPAMGSMLVCGVFPVGNIIAISDANACSLRSPVVPGTDAEIRGARKVLANWVDWYIDCVDGDLDEDKVSALTSAVGPYDFLLWCDDEYENRPDWMKPAWLAYWTSFVGLQSRVDAPSPAPAGLVAHAHRLDRFAEVIRANVSHRTPVLEGADQIPNHPKITFDEFFDRVCEKLAKDRPKWFAADLNKLVWAHITQIASVEDAISRPEFFPAAYVGGDRLLYTGSGKTGLSRIASAKRVSKRLVASGRLLPGKPTSKKAATR